MTARWIHDLMPVLMGGQEIAPLSSHYRGYRLMAVRAGDWKMHLMTQNAYGQPDPITHESPYCLTCNIGPSEKWM